MNDPDDESAQIEETEASVAAGLRWLTVSSLASRVILGIRGLILARLLGPEPVGVFAGVVAFVILVTLAADLGLGSYLIHRGRAARDEARQIVVIAFLSGLAGSVLVALLASFLQDLYGEPQTREVALTISAMVLLSSLEGVAAAVVKTELRFRVFAVCQIAGEATALVVGVALAISGTGVWALVVSSLAAKVVTVILLWLLGGVGRPTWNRESRRIWRRALRFGVVVAGSGAVYAIALQGDNVLIGRLLGATALGLYAFAYNYGSLLGGTIGGIIGHVAFPVFSLAKASPVVLRQHFVRFTRLSAVVAAPLAAVGIAFAAPAVQFFLGPEWTGAVRPLQIILAMGIVWEFYPEKELLRALGLVGLEFRVGAVAAPLVLLSTFIGSQFGLTAVAALVSLVFLGSAVAMVGACARAIKMSPMSALLIPVTYSVAAAATAFVSWLVVRQVALGPGWQVAAGVLISLALYAVVARRWLSEGWNELVLLVRSKSEPRVVPGAIEP